MIAVDKMAAAHDKLTANKTMLTASKTMPGMVEPSRKLRAPPEKPLGEPRRRAFRQPLRGADWCAATGSLVVADAAPQQGAATVTQLRARWGRARAAGTVRAGTALAAAATR
eukprot:gene8608-23288_t